MLRARRHLTRSLLDDVICRGLQLLDRLWVELHLAQAASDHCAAAMRFLVSLLHNALTDHFFDLFNTMANPDLAIIVKTEDFFAVLVILSRVRLRGRRSNISSLPRLGHVKNCLLHAQL